MRVPCFLVYAGRLTRATLVLKASGKEWAELPNGLIVLSEAYEVQDVAEVESDENVIYLGF